MAKKDVAKENKFEGIFADVAPTAPTSPFAGIFNGVETGSRVGASFGTFQPTNFKKIQGAAASAEEASAQAEKDASFGTLARRTITGAPAAVFSVAKQVAEDPKQAAYQAALGLANGITLGATDYLQRRAFIDESKKNGMDELEAEQMAERILMPDDPELAGIRSGFDLAGMAVPFIGTEKLFIAGAKYAAPAWTAKYGRAAKTLVDIGAWNTVGQIQESFTPAEKRDRLGRILTDTSLAIGMNLGGMAFNRIRGTTFKNPFVVAPVSPGATGQRGAPEVSKMLDSSESFDVQGSIKSGSIPRETVYLDGNTVRPDFARGRIDDMAQKLDLYHKGLGEVFRSRVKPDGVTMNGNVPETLLAEAKKVLTEAQAAASGEATSLPPKLAQALFKSPNPEATVAVTARLGKVVAEGARGEGEKITVATNNLDSLRNYIKGSGEIDYKIVKTLGADARGNSIQARHEFNPKTGVHTIYATNETTANQLAHELGHFFDTSLTKTSAGLSRLLPAFERNPEAVQDLLGSFSVARLGGQASSKQVSADIKAVVNNLMKETEALSTARRGAAASSPSERFADAVGEILSGTAKKEQAPTLAALLEHSKRFDDMKLFGKEVAEQSVKAEKEVSALKAAESIDETGARPGDWKLSRAEYIKKYPNVLKKKPEEMTWIEQEKIYVQGKLAQSKEFSEAKTAYEATEFGTQEARIAGRKVQEIDKAADLEITNLVADLKKSPEVAKRASEQLAEYRGKVSAPRAVKGEKIKELPRTQTGKKPETEPFKSELITTDDDLEIFINKTILPKVTGKERIGKSNEDIIKGAFESNLTEASFDKFLTQRFGNLSEDVLKMKRLMSDKAVSLSDTLIGKDLAELSGAELKDAMTQYNQLVEMFEVFAGVRTELSNSFRTLGIAVNAGENDVLMNALQTIQKAIGAEKDPFKIMQKAAETRSMSIVEKYFTVWYPALLSGWKTQVRNITGNASNLALQTTSTLFSKPGEFFPRISAIINANKEGLNLASKVFKGEKTILSKYYEPAVPKDPAFSGPFEFLNKVEYVGRFLNAQDAYFSNAFRESEIAGLRAGKFTYGLDNEVTAKAMDEAIAAFAGQQGTFRNAFEHTFVGEIAKSVAQLKSSQVEGVAAFGNFIFPFVKTIANITDRRLDYVPFLNLWRTFAGRGLYEQRANRILKDANLVAMLREDLVGQGKTLSQASSLAESEARRVKEIVIDRLRNQQLGRFYMGMTVLAAGVPYAMTGGITGSGPKGKNERAVLMKSGWRPNSIFVPGVGYLPYQNTLLPIASILSALGNISDAYKYGAEDMTITDGAFDGLKGFLRSELDQSFLTGISNIYDFVYGYTTGGQFVSKMVANAIPIPAAWTQLKDVIAPQRYEARTLSEQISAKLGSPVDIFSGQNLEPKLDAFGDQVKADIIYGLLPPWGTSVENDPVLEFFKAEGVSIGKPQISTKVDTEDGGKRELTPQEYTTYVSESGKLIYDELEDRVKSGDFKGLTKDEIKSEISKVVRRHRSEVKEQFAP